MVQHLKFWNWFSKWNSDINLTPINCPGSTHSINHCFFLVIFIYFFFPTACINYLSRAVLVLMAITHSSPQDFKTVHCEQNKRKVNLEIVICHSLSLSLSSKSHNKTWLSSKNLWWRIYLLLKTGMIVGYKFQHVFKAHYKIFLVLVREHLHGYRVP